MKLLTCALLGAALMMSVGTSRAADEIHWTITGPTSVTFDWRGAETTLSYGLTPAYGMTVTGIAPSPMPWSSAGPFREARITGLLPDTLYHYAIGSGAAHTFRTPRAPGTSDFVVMAEGDIGSTNEYFRVGIVQQQIADQRPHFTLMVGDLTYGNSNGPAAVDDHFNDVMVWSQDAAYMPAWGNHEYETSNYVDDLRNYKGRFDFPNPRTSPGSPAVSCCGEDWYWFDYGNVRFIAYPEPWAGAWADWLPRANAIMDSAQADPQITFIVTFGHRPAYSSAHHPGSATLQNYLGQLGQSHNKYRLNINGHSHNYERTHPQNGVIHITAGGGGSHLQDDPSNGCLYRSGCPPPAYSAFRAMRHGPVKLSFSAEAIKVEAICGPPGDQGSNPNDVFCTPGTVMDSVTIRVVAPDGQIDTPVGDIAIAPGGSVSFTASGTHPLGLPLSYLWDFDGGAPNSTLEDPGAVVFPATGLYDVKLTAIDATGVADPTPDTRTITVGNVNYPPNGIIVSPAADVTIVQGESVQFTGSATDLNGDLPATYAWNFDEGAPNSNLQNPGLVVFEQDGTFEVQLVVTDSRGLVDPTPATVEVTVTASPNMAPVSEIQSPATNVTIPRGQSVNFQGFAADPDGNTPLTYLWDFDTSATNSTVEDPGAVPFNFAGTFVVRFLVHDALGRPDATPPSRTITVVNPANTRPVAHLALTPTTGNAPLAVMADARASSDSDGPIEYYRFDFGDGAIAGPGPSSTASHVYGPGIWTLKLKVTDPLGAADSSAMQVIVASNLGQNLATNSSVEGSLTGWASYGGGTIQRVNGGFDGAWAIRADGPATNATFGANDSPNWIPGIPAGQVGKPYRFGAWVRALAGTGQARLQIREFNSGIKVGTTTFSPNVALSPTWQLVEVDHVAQLAGSTLDYQVLAYPDAPSQSVLIDNISIRAIDPTTDVDPPAGPRKFGVLLTPNPLRIAASITFIHPLPGFARIQVLDLNGRVIRTLLDRPDTPAGSHSVWFDGRTTEGRPLASGVYFCRVSTSGGSATRRFAIVR